MSVSKLISLFVFLSLILMGCKSSIFQHNSPTIEIDKSDIQLKEGKPTISEMVSGIFSDIFEENDKKTQTANEKTEDYNEVNAKVNFQEFTRLNTEENIRLAISSDPKVLASISKLKRYEAEIAGLNSGKELTSSLEAIGGLQNEDRATDPAAALILSSRKVIYDADSLNSKIESKTYEFESGKEAVLIAADQAALKAYTAWIDLVRYKTISKIFSDGFERTQPLLEQIESVSMSGLTDKKSLLSAQQNVIELQDKFLVAKSREKLAEEGFRDKFSEVDVSTVVESPQVKIDTTDLFEEFDVQSVGAMKEKLLLKRAISSNIKALQASEKPKVAFSASLNAPVQNTANDSVANAGLNLTYQFNDGGALDSRIGQAQAELEILQNETKSLEKSIKMQMHQQSISYHTATERLISLENLITVSKEIQEMSRQQVLSGRSTIKDVLDAEVRLSSLKIDQINSEAEALLALLTVKALKDGLTGIVGWSY